VSEALRETAAANQTLRVAVIGVGHLGKHHARILTALPGVTLVGVADPDAARAAGIAAAHGTQAFADASALPPVDAVVVAAPTELHAELAGPFLSRGVSVLVEKPVTRTLEEADGLIALAARYGAVLAVGHSERFNPAVAAALPHVKAPGFVEVHRLSGFRERSLDIDVVFDLMIHDLDVLLAAIGTEVTAIEAVGVPVLSPRIDIANVRLAFASGCIANLTASRISFDTIRKMRFFQPRAYIGVDFARKEAELYQVVVGAAGAAIDGGKLAVADAEPLQLELEDFVDAARTRRPPRVSGADGRRALELAHRITALMAGGISSGGASE
jgi:predicted dehydrogenase